jgi:hypothetical protein
MLKGFVDPSRLDHDTIEKLVSHVLWNKCKNLRFRQEWINRRTARMSAFFLLKSAEPLVQLELPLTREQLAHPQKLGLESDLRQPSLPFAVEQRHRVAIARLTAIGAIARAQWFTTPESMMVASQCPDGSIQHRFRAHADSRSDRIVYRYFRQDGIPAPSILCCPRRRRFLVKRPRMRISCRGSACRGHVPNGFPNHPVFPHCGGAS